MIHILGGTVGMNAHSASSHETGKVPHGPKLAAVVNLLRPRVDGNHPSQGIRPDVGAAVFVGSETPTRNAAAGVTKNCREFLSPRSPAFQIFRIVVVGT